MTKKRRRPSKCHYCGTAFSRALPATKDHLWPQSMGGTNHSFNIVDACQPCNHKKGNAPPPLITIFEIQGKAVEAMVGLRDMAKLESLALMVAAIAYYLRTKKKPMKLRDSGKYAAP